MSAEHKNSPLYDYKDKEIRINQGLFTPLPSWQLKITKYINPFPNYFNKFV